MPTRSLIYVICAVSEMRSSSHGSMQPSVDGIPHSQSSGSALTDLHSQQDLAVIIRPALCLNEAVNFRLGISTHPCGYPLVTRGCGGCHATGSYFPRTYATLRPVRVTPCPTLNWCVICGRRLSPLDDPCGVSFLPTSCSLC